MSTAIVPFEMPSSLDALASALETNVTCDLNPMLRMAAENGQWTWGVDAVPVATNAERWAVNPVSFRHGWAAWTQIQGQSPKLAVSLLESINVPMPLRPAAALPDCKQGYVKQYAFDLQCLDGEHAGVQVTFQTSTQAGTENAWKLATAIAHGIRKHVDTPIPVVTLGSTSYRNSTHGRTVYKPVFTIVDWIGIAPQE